jgi:8-oxo-dGTP pyrophosphatase MutT (NUDIX family)
LTFNEVVRRVEVSLHGALPGAAAHAALAPRPRRNWPPGVNPARIRDAAGLLLVFPSRRTDASDVRSTAGEAAAPPAKPEHPQRRRSTSAAHIILTVRADTLRHGGQVSLPGGVIEPGETFEQAALREAHEEIALALDDVRVLGALTPIDIVVSGFKLHPIVAAIDRPPLLRPSDGEVAQILEVDVDELVDAANIVETERERDGRTLIVPAFQVAGVEIWGATAMILAEFLSMLGWKRS